MKTKILSLALALMMIVSVAAALPVSAHENDRNISFTDFVDANSAGYEFTHSDTATEIKADGDTSWITKGGWRFYRGVTNKVSTTLEVGTPGYYNVNIAYASPVASTATVLLEGVTQTTFSLPVVEGQTCDTIAAYNAAVTVVDVVSSTDRIYLPKGSYELQLNAAVGACAPVKADGTTESNATPLYLYDMKLAWAEDQTVDTSAKLLEPRDGTIYSTPGNYVFGSDQTPTYQSVTWGDGEADARYFWNGYTSGLDYKVNVAPGWYDVYVAAGNASTAKGWLQVGGSSTDKVDLTVTGAIATAAETNLGSIYIPEGIQTLSIRFTVGSTKLHVFDIKYERSASQPTVYTLTAEAGEGGTAAGANVIEGNSGSVVATPNAGYIFEGWYQGTTRISGATTYTIDSVTENATYTAKFEKGKIVTVASYDTTYENSNHGGYANVGTGGVTNKNGIDWIPAGNILAGANTNLKYNVSGLDVGYYDLYAAFTYSSASASYNKGSFGFYQNDNLIGKAVLTETGLSSTVTPVQVNVGRIKISAEGASFIFKGLDANYGYIRGFKLSWSDNQTPDPIIVDGKDMTFLRTGTATTGTYIGTGSSHNATTNDTDWANSTGLGIMYASKGIEVGSSITPVESGWYSVSVAYGTSQTDADIVVAVDGTSADLYSAAPSTSSRNTVGVVNLNGSVYLEADTTYDINTCVQTAYSGWSATLYSVKFSYIAQAPTEVVINGALPTDGSYIERALAQYPAANAAVDWASFGNVRINGAGHWAEYKIYAPATGYYTVNVVSGTFSGSKPMLKLTVNGSEAVTSALLNSPVGTNNNLLDIEQTVIARVQLNEGENTIRFDGVASSANQRLFNIKLEREDLPTAYDVRIVDAGDNELSTVTGGSRIFAEVALPEGVEGAEIFLAQYKGSGDEKTLVKTSRVGEANVAIYSANGLNFCRTSLTTDAVAGSVKAFLWTADGNYIPLAAFDVATVQ